ncbi:MAG: hydrogenase formation protein HypD [Clostridia bacterium]|nr:hydrogenase formation protein HypD [Clostridia bacterium]
MNWQLLKSFRNPQIVKELSVILDNRIALVTGKLGRPPVLMEVCGTHTMAFSKTGIRSIVRDKIVLKSGPGCPVCVTAQTDIDMMIELAKCPGVILTTFGDMMRVPGSYSNLLEERAKGADVRVVYSPLDALKIAREFPNHEVVFLGIGFETTVPIIAMSIKEAVKQSLKNFSLFSVHKAAAPVISVLIKDQTLNIDGFILPGHVSVVIGESGFSFMAEETDIPAVIAGFDPVDLLQGLIMIIEMIVEEKKGVGNQYTRLVKPEGNQVAQQAIRNYFTEVTAEWRGIGSIPGSGLVLKEEYAGLDACRKFSVQAPPARKVKGCLCGEIIKGKATPFQCSLFDKACSPVTPVGPCMVSVEGTCSAYYNYDRGGNW